MPIDAFGNSDRGCVRAANEDRILVDNALGLYAVCDGMGGAQRGDLAADLAVEALQFYIEASHDRYDVSWPFGYLFELSLDANRLATAVRGANRQVMRQAQQSLDCAGMGTTVAALLIVDGRVVVANVGDSRVYLARDGQLNQITVDDTVIAGMLQKGLLTPAEAAAHPLRNVITQAAGSREAVEVHLWEGTLQPGDVFLICSDGLYNEAPAAAICEVLAREGGPAEAVESLIAAALAHGAHDNVSAVVLRYS